MGSLTTRLSDDSRIIYKASGEVIAKELQALGTLVFGFVIGFSASWKIALVVLATFPITIMASALQMQAVTGQQYDVKGVGDNYSAVISTAFNNMRTVASFSIQYKVSNEYAQGTRKVAEDRVHRSIQGGVGFGGSNLAMFGTYALLFWYGASLIKKGEINFEQLMTAMMSLMLGVFGLGTAFGDLADQAAGLEAAKRVFSSIDEAALSSIDGMSGIGKKPGDKCVGCVELRNVSFSYPSRKETKIFNNFSITINPGETVAFVGTSGSGKSTIMNLLLRFYDPSSGTVFLDGVDIKELNLRWLRSQIGYVGQEPVLFSGTIAENISFGRNVDEENFYIPPLEETMVEYSNGSGLCGTESCLPSGKGADFHQIGDIETGVVTAAVDEDIINSAKLSNAHSFISGFKQGYETGKVIVSQLFCSCSIN